MNVFCQTNLNLQVSFLDCAVEAALLGAQKWLQMDGALDLFGKMATNYTCTSTTKIDTETKR